MQNLASSLAYGGRKDHVRSLSTTVNSLQSIQTAKSVASLDQISSGRFLFGVGAGWNAEEMADHGTNFKTRISLMKERIEAMKVIWTKDRASFQGRFVNFPEMITNPKPFQKPYPPIIMGGAFPYGAQKAIEYSDGWLPHATRPEYGDLIHKIRLRNR